MLGAGTATTLRGLCSLRPAPRGGSRRHLALSDNAHDAQLSVVKFNYGGPSTREDDGIWPHSGAHFEHWVLDVVRCWLYVAEGGCREDLPCGEPLKSTPRLSLPVAVGSSSHGAFCWVPLRKVVAGRTYPTGNL